MDIIGMVIISYLSVGAVFGLVGAVWSAKDPDPRAEPSFFFDALLLGSLWPLLVILGVIAASDFLGQKISKKIGHGLGNRVGLQNRLPAEFDSSVTCQGEKDAKS